MIKPFDDTYFMKCALREAQAAFDKNEVPVGAVITCNNTIIARAHNLTQTLTDVTAHAEMQVFTAASNYLGSKYLQKCTLYVTLEPCCMCAGASFWAQIGKIVYGASDEKRGFLKNNVPIHPKTKVVKGVLETECSEIILRFFELQRKLK
ncbi:MAG: nucleoside deaminase [Flavobacteriaceae bacterium]